ncbi:MAG: TonB family protein [Pseudomonadota bacterium]
MQLAADHRRWLFAPVLGALAVLLLFAFLHWAITPREIVAYEEGPSNEGVQIVKVQPQVEQPVPPQELPQNAPPPPPDAPPSLARPDLSASSAPALTNVAIDAGPVTVNVGAVTGAATGIGGLGNLGSGLGSGFGGFSGGGGGGGGGKGFATGKSFEGKALVPLSTARPQMPEWACKQNLKGWVEVVFTVMPNGRVQDVKIVDANPRGVYEAAAIESVSNWIYAPYKNAREVKQRVPMNPEDCAFNYPG